MLLQNKVGWHIYARQKGLVKLNNEDCSISDDDNVDEKNNFSSSFLFFKRENAEQSKLCSYCMMTFTNLRCCPQLFKIFFPYLDVHSNLVSQGKNFKYQKQKIPTVIANTLPFGVPLVRFEPDWEKQSK